MNAGSFALWPVLRELYGTDLFEEYCRRRKIRLQQVVGFLMTEMDEVRWKDALRSLSEEEQAQIDLELLQVQELGRTETLELLVVALKGKNLPSDTIVHGAPLSLWFFLHHPRLFQEVYFQRELEEMRAWRVAKIPASLSVQDALKATKTLAGQLRRLFQGKEGIGRFSVVELHQIHDALCFTAYLSDRMHRTEFFTDQGQRTLQLLRPVMPILFIYHPDGRLLVKTKRRSKELLLGVLQCFGRAVLGIMLDESCLLPLFHLDLLKYKFSPALDAHDMVQARVKTLHLMYPEREGRRKIKLETSAGDEPFAISEMLRCHVPDADTLDLLTVVYAEIEVKLRLQERMKSLVIRLWPDRCSLDQSPLGERLYHCLARWSLAYAG
jgi:hypothetical protein